MPVKLIEQVQQRHNATQITGGSSAHLIPQTPSMTARHLHPGLASYSSTPGATPSLTPPRTFMSSLQVCAAMHTSKKPPPACLCPALGMCVTAGLMVVARAVCVCGGRDEACRIDTDGTSGTG